MVGGNVVVGNVVVVVGAPVVDRFPGLSGLITVRLSQTTSSQLLHQLWITSHHRPGAHSRVIGDPREHK